LTDLSGFPKSRYIVFPSAAPAEPLGPRARRVHECAGPIALTRPYQLTFRPSLRRRP
jgi:hypothetical protein